ncbi:MAG: glucans biosynthesis glucosyltransferase MdoH [Gammaproteobacteria bacterium]
MTQVSLLTPPTAPLSMPTQVLSRHPDTVIASHDASPWLARLLTFGGSLALTAAASYQLYLILPLNGAGAPVWTALLLWLLLCLFTVTFGWVALTAMAALSGVFYGHDGWHAASDAPLRGRTVLLMPVYNEDSVSACAALAAMAEELTQLDLQQHFEIFVLSDSSEPEIWSSEVAAVQCLRERLAGNIPVWYRRRDRNTARKAGNIRDFINHWGSRYDYMVVLDADSLIAGETLARLVREMDAEPSTGILQTLPNLYGGETLYARLQQFAGVVYGPVFARGLNAWQGHDGNYWGHNAILRVRAFAESAGLPCIPGPRPFGGEIRSHDFVEAALIRRAGWKVRMLPGLKGSWEECPPTLLDAAVRDRRWAQGNVQHLAVVSARGLRWPNRAHMLMGVMNYATSPLWLAMVAVGLLLSTRLSQEPLVASADGGWLLLGGLVFDAERMIRLFILTMTLLLLPKLLGFCAGICRREVHGGQGRVRLVLSAVMELLFSILHAPIVMLLHSRHLWEIVRGQDSGWSAQQRRGRRVSWKELLYRHGWHTAVGLLVTTQLLWLSSPLLYWMLPMVVGLMLAIPLSALSGSRRFASLLARAGLLHTPEECKPPAIMRRRDVFQDYFVDAVSAAGRVLQPVAAVLPAADRSTDT